MKSNCVLKTIAVDLYEDGMCWPSGKTATITLPYFEEAPDAIVAGDTIYIAKAKATSYSPAKYYPAELVHVVDASAVVPFIPESTVPVSVPAATLTDPNDIPI